MNKETKTRAMQEVSASDEKLVIEVTRSEINDMINTWRMCQSAININAIRFENTDQLDSQNELLVYLIKKFKTVSNLPRLIKQKQ